MSAPPRLSPLEVFGLRPLGKALRETALAVRGDGSTPPSRFDRSSLALLDPRLSLPLWLGRRRPDRRVELYNLFNRRPTPVEEGWSVRVTQVEDFLGGGATYDSHNGTDFAVPVGTVVVAAAPGVVLRVSSEMNRGGLKVFIDHGFGLVTTSNHLGRALVSPGERVARGQPVALSGASGIDCLAFFPWSCPHVHYNVWLNGVPVDPFAAASAPGEISLFRGPTGLPVPASPGERPELDADFAPTAWDADAVDAAVAACRHAGARAEIDAQPDSGQRAMAALFQLNYYPTRFGSRPNLYGRTFPRAPRLDLPFRAEDFDGVSLPRRRTKGPGPGTNT